ncbi:MAG: hypothetical protein DMF84_04130 [Acidobacteria bacterium]|nr:MAG: hypothetical protein DMF84_04130 [Acidobacteriota bacterium]
MAVTLAIATSCHPAVPSTRAELPTADKLAELWFSPQPGRDLFWGIGGQRLAPDVAATYKVIDVKKYGFSPGMTIVGPGDRHWSVKFPPEASTEVVASRILWGVGYHQPPIYYVGRWNAEGSPEKNPQLPARFRESKPDVHGLDAKGTWSYYRGPFVGTREQNGLLVLQVMLGNSDLKDEQNAIYELKQPLEGASRWYVARDLGQSFGRTGVINAPRGDVQVFEQTPFIKAVVDGRVRFDYRGRHGVLVERMTPDDVRWICEKLAKLTDRQWDDAFRAGGYAPELAARFIRRFKQKIQEGLALK